MNRVSVSLSKSLNTAISADGIDLPHSQFIVLRCLYYNDGISQFDIANLLSKDAAAIKRTVDLLEEKRLVVRKQIRALKNSVCITDKGRELMPRGLKIAEQVMDEALNGIGKKHQNLLFTMLERISTNLEK